MFSRKTVILELGASRVALATFSCCAGKLHLERHEQELLPAPAAGEDHWLEHVKAALAALGERTKPGSRVTLVLPPHVVLSKIIRVPRFDRGKRDKVIRFAAEAAIPCPLADVAWDHVAAADHDLEVMLAAVKRGLLEELCGAVRAAGFEIGAVLPGSLATLAAFRLAPVGKEPAVALNVGARSATLLLTAGRRFVVRTFACDARGEALATRLGQEVTRSVLYFRRQGGWEEPARLCLMGGGARLAGLPEALSEALKLPVDRVEGSTLIENGSADAELTDLVGAAATRLCSGQASMNLRPPSRRAGWKRPLQMVGATLVIGLAAWPLWPERRLPARPLRIAPVVALMTPPAPLEPVAVVPTEVASEAIEPVVVKFTEAEPAPCPLRIAGYIEGPDGYQVAFANVDGSGVVLVRNGHRFESLGLTLRSFEVRKAAVAHADTWPVYEVAAFARFHDERTGGDLVLDSRIPRT